MKQFFAAIALAMAALHAEPATARGLLFTGPMWEKSFEAKKDQPTACFYGTVTFQQEQSYARGLVGIFFRNIAEQGEYSPGKFEFFPKESGRGTEFKLQGDFGYILEACVVPGQYAISGINFAFGMGPSGPSMILGSRGFKPVEFLVEPGKSYYIGNFRLMPGNPQHFQVSAKKDRDAELIGRLAKRKPLSELEFIELELGDNYLLQPER